MGAEIVCVYIPIDEYRELVRTQRDAECLRAILWERLKMYGGIKHEELEILCKMFVPMESEDTE